MYNINEIYNTFIEGDTLSVLKNIPDSSIHLTVTSPPYNAGKEYGVDDSKTHEDYLSYIKDVFREIYRVTIDGGRIAVNVPLSVLHNITKKNHFLIVDYIILLRDIGWLDREIIHWLKTLNGSIPGCSTKWGSWRSPSCPHIRDATEVIIIMYKKLHKRVDKHGINDITSAEFMKISSNLWYIPTEANRKHPAPFPKELPYRLIKFYSWQDDVIFDPFMGSGTTAIAAQELGRKWIGIEINPEYIKYAKHRLISAESKSLFNTNKKVVHSEEE